MWIRRCGLSWLTACLLLAIAPLAFADARDWLMRIHAAAANHSFVGNFVYSHDDRIEAMHVVRRVQEGLMQERLYALNGEAREVVRDRDRVWCYIPDKKVAVHDYRQTSESGFPRILPADLEVLGEHYRFALGDTARIADRMAQQVQVQPADDYRYGYHLWADTETGLLLRSDLVDDGGSIVEQYLFVNIKIGGDIADAELESVTSREDLVWYGMDMPNMSKEVSDTAWRVESLPPGYRLTRHIKRMDPMKMEEEEHMVFTDGLSSVSVFVKESKEGQSGMVGLSRMGAIHAFRETVAGHWVTVMGEVPARTVKHLAEAIAYRP